MPYNRIAVYSHRGWASSAIVDALVSSGAPIKVLYRPESDASGLPPSVTKVEVNVQNQQQLIDALQDVDILISLVGHEGVESQHGFVKAIPSTNVKLFVPSDLGPPVHDEQGLRVPVNKAKHEVETAAKDAGIPTATVLVGSFADLLGVDYTGNRIIFTGDSANQKLNICTRDYVAAAYASIFARTPPAQVQGRAIGLSELQATGNEVASALERKHGADPQIFAHSLEKVEKEVHACIERGIPLSLPWWCRKAWGNGTSTKGIDQDTWEVEGYQKLPSKDCSWTAS